MQVAQYLYFFPFEGVLGYFCRHTIRQRCVQIPVSTRVEDPHNFNADPDLDPAFHFNADPNPDFNFNARIRVRILLLIQVMRICDHCSTEPPGLHFQIQASTVSVHGPPSLHFENLTLPSFEFHADSDSDPAFHSNADQAPASQRGSMRIRIRIRNPSVNNLTVTHTQSIIKLINEPACCGVAHRFGSRLLRI